MPSWVGDVVMATPFLRSLRARFPGSHVTLLLKRHLYDLVAGAPWMDECVFWPKGREKRWLAYRRWYRSQRAVGYDLAVLLPNSFRTAWTAWRIGARRRVGFRRDGRGWLLTDAVPVPNRRGRDYEPMPLVTYYGHLASALGCPWPGDRLELFVDPQAERAVRVRLNDAGLSAAGPRVVLCPGARFGSSKCWMPERFAEVADRLVETHGANVVISPGPGEEPLAHAISAAMTRPHHVLDDPCLTLGELMALIAGADLLLGNDTGPRHFARAFAIPRVTVFGPTEPKWTETSHGGERIVRVDVPCGPCHRKTCPLGHLQCMTRVSADMVEQACHAVMKRPEESMAVR